MPAAPEVCEADPALEVELPLEEEPELLVADGRGPELPDALPDELPEVLLPDDVPFVLLPLPVVLFPEEVLLVPDTGAVLFMTGTTTEPVPAGDVAAVG